MIEDDKFNSHNLEKQGYFCYDNHYSEYNMSFKIDNVEYEDHTNQLEEQFYFYPVKAHETKVFLSADRGIMDFLLLNEEIKRIFPNLNHLIIQQNYTYSETNEDLTALYFLQFIRNQTCPKITFSDQQSGFWKYLDIETIANNVSPNTELTLHIRHLFPEAEDELHTLMKKDEQLPPKFQERRFYIRDCFEDFINNKLKYVYYMD